jgi:hypothetical protein
MTRLHSDKELGEGICRPYANGLRACGLFKNYRSTYNFFTIDISISACKLLNENMNQSRFCPIKYTVGKLS